jgi:diguanylate cyclase (GGDEF)-like protein/PAS domain S-box-containing protein
MDHKREESAWSGGGDVGLCAMGLDALPNPAFIFEAVRDTEGRAVDLRYVHLNEEAVRLYKMPLEDVLGKTLTELFPSTRELGVLQSYLEPLQTREASRMRVAGFNENGVAGTFDVAAAAFGDRVIVSAIDSSAHAYKEEQFRSIVEAMEEGVVFHNAAGEIVAANSSAERILGQTFEELSGRTSVDVAKQARIVYPDGSAFPGDEHPAMVTLRTGAPQHDVDMGLRWPDGTLRWISINTQPLFMPGSTTPIAVVATFRDVTSRHALHAALERAEAMRDVAEGIAGMGVYRWDLKSDLAEWSPGMFEIWDVDRDGFDGSFAQILRERLHPEDFDRVAGLVDRAAAGSILESNPTGYRLVLRDGSEREIENDSAVERDVNGEIVAVVGYCRDVTERSKVQTRDLAVDSLLWALEMPAYALDADLKFIAFTKVFAQVYERAYGVVPRVAGSYLEGLSSALERDSIDGIFRRVLAGETVDTAEWRGSGTDRRQWSIVRAPLTDKRGVVGVVSIAHDTTAAAVEALQSAERSAVLGTAVDAVKDAIIFTDSSGYIASINKATERLTLCRASQVVGQPASTICAPERQGVFEGELMRALGGEAVSLSHTEIGFADGPRTEVAVSMDPLKSEEGTPLGALIVCRAIEMAAYHDSLTSLCNRRGLAEFGGRAVAQARRVGTTVGVMFFDIDNMKSINDSYGHQIGDVALQDMTEVLHDVLREVDVIARLGGDEFVVVAANVTDSDLEGLAERVDRTLATFNSRRGRPYQLEVSCGAAVEDAVRLKNLQDLVNEADARMYEQKSSKR